MEHFKDLTSMPGKLFEKGLTIGTGQCNVKVGFDYPMIPLSLDTDECVKAYNRYLRDLIISGKAKPSIVVSHNLSLNDAADAYDKFDRRIDGYTKVLLHP
jgi:threonine dehydrogenase-like Zn-dependent dehydrogenase